MQQMDSETLKIKVVSELAKTNFYLLLNEYFLHITEKHVINKLREGVDVSAKEYEALMFVPNMLASDINSLTNQQ